MTSQPEVKSNDASPFKQFLNGTIAISPLSIAVLPWGLLAGSYAVDSGLSPFDSQMLSVILYAGAAQLVAIGMLKSGVGLFTMLLTTFFITSRHFLYGVSMRSKISPLPKRWRWPLGFLLTDELFAICGQQKDEQFNRWYALGAGLSFYIVWNIASLVGILAGHYIPNLNQLGLDFAVAATFIAIVIPNTKTFPVLVCVLVSLVLAVVLETYQVQGSLMIASLVAMVAGYLCETWVGEK